MGTVVGENRLYIVLGGAFYMHASVIAITGGHERVKRAFREKEIFTFISKFDAFEFWNISNIRYSVILPLSIWEYVHGHNKWALLEWSLFHILRKHIPHRLYFIWCTECEHSRKQTHSDTHRFSTFLKKKKNTHTRRSARCKSFVLLISSQIDHNYRIEFWRIEYTSPNLKW